MPFHINELLKIFTKNQISTKKNSNIFEEKKMRKKPLKFPYDFSCLQLWLCSSICNDLLRRMLNVRACFCKFIFKEILNISKHISFFNHLIFETNFNFVEYGKKNRLIFSLSFEDIKLCFLRIQNRNGLTNIFLLNSC